METVDYQPDDGARLVFIVGHYKSGSSWLTNMLSLHPDLRALRETHVFRLSKLHDTDFTEATSRLFTAAAWADGGPRRFLRNKVADWTRPVRRLLGLASGQALLGPGERASTLHDLSLSDQRRLRRRLLQSSDSEDFCRTFFGFMLSRLRPGRYLIEKTPTNVEYAPMIKAVFPKARLVAIYRDGRDVVISDAHHLAREYHTSKTLEERAEKWRAAMQRQIDYQSRYDLHCLAYEELSAHPEEVLMELLRFLDLPTDAEVVADMIRRSSFEFVTGRKPGQEDPRNFYRKGVARDWVGRLSDDDRARFAKIAGDMLVSLGYERSSDWREWA